MRKLRLLRLDSHAKGKHHRTTGQGIITSNLCSCCYLATILDETAATTKLTPLRVLELKNQSEHIGAKEERKEKKKNLIKQNIKVIAFIYVNQYCIF